MHYAARMKLVKPSAIRELLKLGEDPSIISFGGGYPDPSLFPTDGLAESYRSTITEHGRTALQYSASSGLRRLREQVAARVANDGTACDPDQVLILQGAQQGLDLVGKMLIDSGDTVLTENPTFLGALVAFNPYQPRYHAIAMDGDGIDTDAVDAFFRGGGRAKFLYTVPDFQNPTGVTMSLARRQRLVELARTHDFIILEDSPYRDVRFQGPAIPTLLSLDTDGRVIHLGSFSKILAPGLRLGWAVAPQPVIDKLTLLKLAADTQCSTLNMLATSRFLDAHDIEAQIARIRDIYRGKRDLMLAMLRAHFPQSVEFTEPNGGLFTWLTFPAGFDTAQFMAEQAVPLAKVAYVPGATFFPTDGPCNHARFSFSTQSDEAIEAGVARLGALLRKTL
ncbi:aminotransferase [Rhodospirillales bacterium TMPK1]|uniref:Aminotransferase n=2 Tax=Roseiterribacter gracilis TaxID=2812848 RepID=A0A8S8X974_9PROT|nr:aminotransferase [Rhodospirillales bacterium TMPK1]